MNSWRNIFGPVRLISTQDLCNTPSCKKKLARVRYLTGDQMGLMDSGLCNAGVEQHRFLEASRLTIETLF